MEPRTSTGESSSQLNDRPWSSSDFDLDLPIDPDFRSEPPKLDFLQHLRFCDEILAFNHRIGRKKSTRATPASEEFVL
jgi:hypothetical protein